jgi:arginine:agmatine antiporter
LVACGLLVFSSPVKTLVGAAVVILLSWAAWRGFGRRRDAGATDAR